VLVVGFLLALGVAGIVVLVLTLVVGDLFDGLLDGLGWSLPTEAVAGFAGGFGFAGAAALSVTGSPVAAGLVGLGVGTGLATGAVWLFRTLSRDTGSGSPRTSDLLEARGQVLHDIPPDGFGVVTVTVAGNPTRIHARADRGIPAGTTVVVVAVISPTAVSVTPLFET